MSTHEDVEYRVLLVFPGFGTERENALEILEGVLDHLNTHRDKPGFRFAPYVTARLEIVPDVDEAYARLETADDLAMMILHDLEEDEMIALTRACLAQEVPVCHTVPAENPPRPKPPRTPGKPREWQIVFRKKSEVEEPRAHKIEDTVLTAPLDDGDDEWPDRVSQLIAVLALGVMEHHWKRTPPSWNVPLTE